jgi:hypothetical protein
MLRMAKDTDWGKHSALSGYLNALIAAIFGCAVIALTVYIWLHPYDPKSPPTWGVPAIFWGWLSTWGPPLLSALCLGFALWVYSKAKALVNSAPAVIENTPARQQDRAATIPASIVRSVDPPHLEHGEASGDESFSISSDSLYTVKVQKHSWENTRGLVLVISNEGLSWIEKIKITVYSAQSFDAKLKEYRDGHAFQAVVMQQPNPIEASGIGRAIWLVRKDGNSDQLLVGDDSRAPLKWPSNDLSPIRRWIFSVGIDGMTVRTPAVPSKPLEQIQFKFSVDWDKATNEFSLVAIQ